MAGRSLGCFPVELCVGVKYSNMKLIVYSTGLILLNNLYIFDIHTFLFLFIIIIRIIC